MSTDSATTTAAECLRLALFGGVDEWMRLHEMCRDFTVAQTVFALLSTAGPEHRVTVESWRQLLKELHPNLDRTE